MLRRVYPSFFTYAAHVRGVNVRTGPVPFALVSRTRTTP